MGEALASYDRALALRPDYAEAFNNRAVALCSLKRFAESLADCDRALALRPGFRRRALQSRQCAVRTEPAAGSAGRVMSRRLAVDPAHPNALSGLANAAMTIGDWERTAELADRLEAGCPGGHVGDPALCVDGLLGRQRTAAALLAELCAPGRSRPAAAAMDGRALRP